MTNVRSAVVVELDNDGISRHVSHLRRVPAGASEESGVIAGDDSDTEDSSAADGSDSEPEEEGPRPRRERRPPGYLRDYVR